MADDSTTFLKTDIKGNSVKTPRSSTLLFIRQFARVYFNSGESDLTSFVVN
ncbi:MAG: hypothetical protein HDR88_08400 [Bacteroides sp.]|nr:hypothetical protein [Bacteroides sp.]